MDEISIKKEEAKNNLIVSNEELQKGLLYELNRSIFHTINMQMTICEGEIFIEDHRKDGINFVKLDKKLARQGEEVIIKEQEKRFKKLGYIAQI